LGLEARTESDSLRALVDVVREAPHLLIMDPELRGVDGLYVCRTLVREQAGRPIPIVVLTDRPDENTKQACEEMGLYCHTKGPGYWIRLEPAIRELLGLQSRTPGAHHAAPAPHCGTETGKPRVLVIDDDSEVRKALKIRLEAKGIDVCCASDAAEGYRVAVSEAPQMVICDYVMPGGYGNTVMRRLRDNSVTRNIPLLVLTGRTISGSKDFALERELRSLGAVGYLTKPVDLDVLISELGRFIPVPAQPARTV
jgi:CheY-like chemotaxis protein